MSPMTTLEANLDGLVGPTHNYAGLSYGNVASEKHAKSISNPKAAALQGLRKMKFLMELGVPQLVMPPQPRPHKAMLAKLGYKSFADAPVTLLNQLFSASSMWTANAATISPSSDTRDGKLHITPANLVSHFHRSIEAATTASYLQQIFVGPAFAHHPPLPPQALYADEGAANHMRLCSSYGEAGLEIFVYGGQSRTYPARQTKHSVEAIARLHELDSTRVLFLEQSPEAIDAGVFHNDVIAMSNGNTLVAHEKAFTGGMPKLPAPYSAVAISENELSLPEAVSTYFFNSQWVTSAAGKQTVIAPSECAEHPKAKACFNRLLSEGVFDQVHYLDVRESMKNGGGPACLRLRVVLSDAERAQLMPKILLNDTLFILLCEWIEKHYRDRMAPDDLRDLSLAEETSKAMDELSGILNLRMEAA